MRSYVLRRVLHALLTLLGVSLVVFGLLRVLPGDPAKMVLPEGASAAQVEQVRRQLGLLEPLYVQYGVFVSSTVRGDLGQSFQFKAPVTVRDRRADLADRPAGRRLVLADGQPGRAGRHRRRRATPDPARLRQHLPDGVRPVAAELLARDHADPAVRGRPRLAADLRLPGAELPDPAVNHAGRLPDGAGGAPDPVEHARSADEGVRAHRAQQGPARARRRRSATP